MKSITVHNIDSEIVEFIEEKAREWDLSLNKTIKRILKKYKSESKPNNEKKDFFQFIGKWTEEEFNEFQKNTEIFNKIDEDLWK